MKTFPRFALAAALLAGASGLVVTPAVAKDKKKEEQAGPKKPAVSNEATLKQMQAAEAALKAKDYPTATAALTAAEGTAKTDGDRYFLAALRLQVAAAQLPATGTAGDATLAPLLDTLLAMIGSGKMFSGERTGRVAGYRLVASGQGQCV